MGGARYDLCGSWSVLRSPQCTASNLWAARSAQVFPESYATEHCNSHLGELTEESQAKKRRMRNQIKNYNDKDPSEKVNYYRSFMKNWCKTGRGAREPLHASDSGFAADMDFVFKPVAIFRWAQCSDTRSLQKLTVLCIGWDCFTAHEESQDRKKSCEAACHCLSPFREAEKQRDLSIGNWDGRALLLPVASEIDKEWAVIV